MLRITKESEYAFLLLSALISEKNTPKSATMLSEQTGIAGPITAKVLKRLVRHNILFSLRGVHGGYQLSRPPEEISALDVVDAMEGSPELVDCALHDIDCSLANHCRISPFWQRLNADITHMMAQKTLDAMYHDAPICTRPVIIADRRAHLEEKNSV